MSGQCKVCSSSAEVKLMIESRINSGESLKDLAKSLGDFGISISHPSLLRHKKNHMNEFKENGLKYTEDMKRSEGTIYNKDTLNELLSESANINHEKIATQNTLFMQKLMGDICLKHLLVVDTLLNRYSEGICAYPNDQIRGLKTIFDMMKELPSYNSSSINVKISKNDVLVDLNEVEQLGFVEMEEYSKNYHPQDLFRLESETNKKPISFTDDVDAIGMRTKHAIYYDQGRDRWATLNSQHPLANDLELSNYIEDYFRKQEACEELESLYDKVLATICAQPNASLTWFKSLNILK